MKPPELPDGGYDLVDTRKDGLKNKYTDFSNLIINDLMFTSFSCLVKGFKSSACRRWYVLCKCGKKYFWVTPHNAKKGKISCGCLRQRNSFLHGDKIRNGNLLTLLQDTPQARYWIGFLLADGCFFKGYIKCALCIKDEKHLQKLGEFLNTKVRKQILSERSKICYGKNRKVYKSKDRACLSVSDKILFQEICYKYDIKPRKTYNPPDFSKLNLTDEERYDIAIGYIDGDGSNDNGSIRITNHKNWEVANKILFDKLMFSSYICKTRPNYVRIHIKKDMVLFLLQHIQKYNLPVLERKWYPPKKK